MRLLRARALCLASLLLAAAAGCSTRDRINPLDPANARTHGEIPGFSAIAANGLVELRWEPLTQSGVVEYAVQRWKPGEAPRPLPGAVFPPRSVGSIDLDVLNDTTYVYRLVARFDYGDSAVSPPDSATPGNRVIEVLSAGLPGVMELSPDARDIVVIVPAANAFEDFDIDRDRGVLWLSDPVSGVVLRHGLNGEIAGVPLPINGVTDVSVSSLRGVGWIAVPDGQRLEAYGPDLNNPDPRLVVGGVGHARVVEAGTGDPTVWVGSDEGTVFRLNPSDGAPLEQWHLGAPIRAIALDQSARSAWIVTSRGAVNDLYYLVPGDTSAVALRTGLDNVADVEVEPKTRTLWLSERGEPRGGAGRISRLGPGGTTLATLAAIEPYGVAVEPGSDHVWVASLARNRLLELDATASVVRESPSIGVPYGVLVHVP
ncbi:MAG TPA: hypothetical protein VFS09_05095 [Candidatus Eisenbacteria bacterium]|nr:hypothetical protein [Candidatus Eisenbacteria bacterium]